MVTSNPPGPFQPTWDSLENWQVPEWYLDAKFGIFIHWGVYSVPAFSNEWYPRHMYIHGTKEFDHHVATYGPQDKFGYKDFIPEFKAEKFDPAAWADLFADAGAKFVVPVAEHHDGFAMYETTLSKWNAKEMGPHRDVIADLAAAVKEKGMIFGLSSHRAEHWFFMNGGRDFPSDVQDPEYQDFYGPAVTGTMDKDKNPPSQAFMDDWLGRCAELVDKYRPQLFWFDWWIEQAEFAPHLRRFASYYYNRAYGWGAGVAINYKHHAFPEKAAIYDVERGQLAGIRERFWQTDTAVAKNSWSHVEGMDYKQASTLIYDLVDIVCKNGALLLNIGPRADGTIPEEDQAILKEIGAWLKVNGEAIYGTRPWKVFGEGPTEIKSGYFTDGEDKVFTEMDFRFTTKGEVVLVTCLAEPTGALLVKSLASTMTLSPKKVAKVCSMSGDELEWSQGENGLTIQPTSPLPSRHAICFKVVFA